MVVAVPIESQQPRTRSRTSKAASKLHQKVKELRNIAESSERQNNSKRKRLKQASKSKLGESQHSPVSSSPVETITYEEWLKTEASPEGINEDHSSHDADQINLQRTGALLGQAVPLINKSVADHTDSQRTVVLLGQAVPLIDDSVADADSHRADILLGQTGQAVPLTNKSMTDHTDSKRTDVLLGQAVPLINKSMTEHTDSQKTDVLIGQAVHLIDE